MDYETRRRQPSPDYLAAKAARQVVRPFMATLESGHSELARIRALVASPYSSHDTRLAAIKQARQLRSRVETALRELNRDAAGCSPHGRVDDVRAAIVRLLGQLDELG